MAEIIRTIAELRARVRKWRTQGESVALVPTMGALHEGHLSLLRLGKAKADRVVISIFVNPTQFNQSSDLDNYPRREARDAELASSAGADIIFMPGVEEIYPSGHKTKVQVTELTDVLCGATRPSHFDGVALVVSKLLLQCLPDIAIFGEKDYQQLLIIKTLVKDLDIPVEIFGAPLIRDEHGLALSSRNLRLSEDGIRSAHALPKCLKDACTAIEAGADIQSTLEKTSQALKEAGFEGIDYLEVRDENELKRLEQLDRPARIFVAAILEGVRLIDNMPLAAKK